MFELIKKLAGTFGVSGCEQPIRELIKNEIINYVDDIRIDALGNLIALKKGDTHNNKIMVSAHMDESGVIITHIDDKGFIRFSNIGNLTPVFLVSRKVIFMNNISGIIYHDGKAKDIKDKKLSDLYIDIGAGSDDGTPAPLDIGDTAAFPGETALQGGFIMSGKLDNRAGCAVLIKSIKRHVRYDSDIYYVFTAQNRLGLRGAATAAYSVAPDYSISIDASPAKDIPGNKISGLKCGSGPAVRIMGRHYIFNPEIRKKIEEAANRNNVHLQSDIAPEKDADADVISINSGGIPSGAVTIPCRYCHSMLEMMHMNDIENTLKLLDAFLL